MIPETASERRPKRAFQVVFLIIGLLVVPAALTLRTVAHPGRFEIISRNPTPLGYTVSLLLFIVPIFVLSAWFFRRADLPLQHKSFRHTLLVLAPLGFVLDLLFGNTFFTFPNSKATIGIAVPAVAGSIPIEEFIFYLAGFSLVLMSYIWAAEYWVDAYNLSDHAAEAKKIERIVRFHLPSVVLGVALIAIAVVYKRLLSTSREGFPWYFTYLVLASIIPSAGFFHTVQRFVNWRAFSFTFFLMLFISLLWEVTLAVPYGWWGYRQTAMMGLNIGAWSNLPIEAVCVWLAVSFTSIIIYEVVKIWRRLDKGVMDAFFGARHGRGPVDKARGSSC
jgi:hypothetical protein